MSHLLRSIRSHPMVPFYLLACLFGWSIFIAAWLGLGSEPDNMPLGPLFAAAITTALLGREAFLAWGRSLLHWAAPVRWYLLVLIAPALVDAAIVLVNAALGAPLPTAAQLASWPTVPVNFLVMIIMVGIGEEAGWTAFAAPRLLDRYGLLRAWLLLATLRSFWHLPLMVTGLLPWVVGIVGNFGFQLIVLWLITARPGAWSLAAVWHTTLNVLGGGFAFHMVSGADRDRLGYLLAAAYALLALVVLPDLIRRRRRQPADAAATEPADDAFHHTKTFS